MLLALLVGVGPSFGQGQGVADIDSLMSAVRTNAPEDRINVVRQAALRESALSLGAQRGLKVASCEINAAIERHRVAFDAEYRFADLIMGAGVLPPVITELRDTVALESTVMRVASRLYRIEEPARVVDVPPTWRDFLTIGLDIGCANQSPDELRVPEDHRPKNKEEEGFFRTIAEQGYRAGFEQAYKGFELNTARLKRTHLGMRKYFELYARGMVSAPAIVSNTDVMTLNDPNTLIVGDTIIRITQPANFVPEVESWKPLLTP